MVGEDIHVVLVQVLRHLGVGQHLLLEVFAPVAPHGADQEKEGFAFPLRSLECRGRMLHEPDVRRLEDVAPGVPGAAREDPEGSERKNGEGSS